MEDKYRYRIFPERKYVFDWDGMEVEVEGSEIVNLIPDILRRKYVEAFFGYDEVPFDKECEGLVE
jgi:hypothetical protein